VQRLLKISEQTVWQVLSKIVNAASTLLVLGLITRNYGTEGTGVYTLALTYIIFFYLAADLSLNNYFLTKYSKGSKDPSYLFSLRLVWSVCLIVLANLLVYFMPFNTPLFQMTVLVGSLAILLNNISVSTNLIFQANLKYQQYMIASVVGSLMMLISTYFLSLKPYPISVLMLGVVFGWLINNIISFYLANKLYPLKFLLPSWGYLKNLLITVWPLSATLILNTIYFRLDSFVLTSLKGFEEVAIYNLSYSIFQTILVIPTFIMNSYYPLMLLQIKENLEKFNNQIKLAGLFLLLFSVLVIAITWMAAPIIIGIIAGGGFSKSADTLRYLVLTLPAFFLSSLFMWTLMSLKKFRTLFLIYLVGLFVNLILNLLLIPVYGINGAIITTAISEYLILSMQVMILWRGIK